MLESVKKEVTLRGESIELSFLWSDYREETFTLLTKDKYL